MWTLAEALARAGGRLRGADVRFESVGTDSRRDCRGQLFVALRGERFDGHEHAEQARAAGAVALMLERELPVDLPQWIVEDTRAGLGQLAHAWRARLDARVIALTGSNGKTTVKEMLAAILSRTGRVLATTGNLNNDIGLPLTLLRARDEDFLVLEIGANHPGEISALSTIARPEAALITSIGRAHLEGFGSLDGVAQAKGEIVEGLLPGGFLVVPGDSPYTETLRERAGGRRVATFALDAPAILSTERAAIRSEWTEAGFRTRFNAHYGGREWPMTLRLAGEHNVRNALAASTVALMLGVDAETIAAGLAELAPVPGRLCPLHCTEGWRVIDDTYNANPDSIAAAIEVLAGLDGRRTLVLGDLGELGADAELLHAEIGARAREAGLDRLFTVGELSAAASASFGEGAQHYRDQDALIADLHTALHAGDAVLVKGSRRARMERVVAAICAGGGR